MGLGFGLWGLLCGSGLKGDKEVFDGTTKGPSRVYKGTVGILWYRVLVMSI